jgi:hypothetical protein
MSGVPPKHRPFNFNDPVVGKDGKLSSEWQLSMNALQQRVEAPVSSVPPATATSPGIPGQIAFDATHVYVCIAGGSWIRAAFAGF